MALNNPMDIRVGCPYYYRNQAYLVTAIAREFDLWEQIVVFEDLNKQHFYLTAAEFAERFNDER